MVKRKSNDSTVMELKKQVEEKKSILALNASKAFNPKTNCSLMLNGERINIRAEQSREKVVELLVFLNSQKMSAMELAIVDYTVSGFRIQDWVDDLSSRLMNIDRKLEEDRLKVLEAKLHTLLSSDKKVELEIEDLKGQI